MTSDREALTWCRLLEDRLKDEWGAHHPMKVTNENGMKIFRILVVTDDFAGKSKDERDHLVRDAIGFKPSSKEEDDLQTVDALGSSRLEITALLPSEQSHKV